MSNIQNAENLQSSTVDMSNVIVILIIVVVIYLLYDIFYYSSPKTKTNKVDADQIIETEESAEEIGESEEETELEELLEEQEESVDSSSTVRSTMNNTNDSIENFMANGIDNPVIDQGTWENAYALMNPPLTAGGKDDMSQRLIIHQVSNKEFIALITEIEAYISNTIIKYAKTCKEMHGDEVQLHDGKRGLSLACVTDPYALKDEIIDGVYEMIYQFIKSRFDINMNPYMVYYDLDTHMGLMERVIYPLQFSGLYTVHGVQYTNEDWIRNKVHDNLSIKDVLVTTFSRRGVEINVNTDQHIH